MLTRELLMHRTTKGRIKPGFLDTENKSLRNLARDLIDIFTDAEGQSRETIETAANEKIAATRRTKVAKGLLKLLFDRSDFRTADPEAMKNRLEIFHSSVQVFRNLSDGASIESYREAIANQSGKSMEIMEDALYSDLAPRRPLEGFKQLTDVQLLERYNLAQVQGLLLYAQNLDLRIRESDISKVRKLLRWLRFCRLVAQVKRDEDFWSLVVEGPGAILSMQKKYGLQMANFMTGVPFLSNYTLEAVVQLPRKPKATLIIDHTDELRSLRKDSGSGYIPEEISKTAEAFESENWDLDLLPEPCYLGKSELCVPDFRFRHSETGISVAMELFHRWHKGPLIRRIEDLNQYPDPNFVLGVDKALVSNPEIKKQVENNEQIFVFNAFPSLSKIRKALKRYE